MVILGMGCKAQVGKDTAADYLMDKDSSFAKVAFADKLKQVCMLLFGLTHEQCYGPKEVKETVDPRYGMSPREIMQKVGDGMRKIYPSIWIDTVFYSTIPELEKEGYSNFVISDVRYPNEGDRLKEIEGAFVVRVDRDAGGTEIGADHPSETSMDNYHDWDFIIKNNGTLEEYYDNIDQVLEEIKLWQAKGEEKIYPNA